MGRPNLYRKDVKMKKEDGMTLVTLLSVLVILAVLLGVVINLLFGESKLFYDIKDYVCNVLNIPTNNNQTEFQNHYIYNNENTNTNENISNYNNLNTNTNVQSSSWYN